MTVWHTFSVEPSLLVTAIQTMPELPASIEKKITLIWQKKTQEQPKLFNGQVFCATSLSPTRIEGYWTEYRRILAQMTEPELFSVLALRPLAVTGLLSTPEGFVMGLRTKESIYMANYWQSPPAGTVENRNITSQNNIYLHPALPIDLNQQLLSETQEELGLAAEDIHIGLPLTATEHEFTHIVDIGITLSTPLSFNSIKEKWQISSNKEYSELALLRFEEAEQSPFPTRFSPLVPTTSALVKAWKKNKIPS